MLNERLLALLPFTWPEPIGLFIVNGFATESRARDLYQYHRDVVRSLYLDPPSGCPLTFMVFCTRNPLNGEAINEMAPPELLAEARRQQATLGDTGPIGVGMMINMKPSMACNDRNKDALALAVRKLCELGRAVAVLTYSEVWLNNSLTRTHKGSLEGLPGTTEHLMVQLESKVASFMGTAAITRDGDKVSLGDWRDISDGRFQGRFTGLLSEPKDVN